MSEPARQAGGRSGCALVLGVLLIATGTLFLAQNLFDYSLYRLFRGATLLFTDYWPVLLVVWGGFKVYQRFATPARAGVSASEIVLLILIVVSGLTLRGARRALREVADEAGLEEMAAFAGLDVLVAPAHSFSDRATFVLGEADRIRIANPGGNVRVSSSDGSDLEIALTKRVYRRSEDEASRLAEAVKLDFASDGALARLTVLVPAGEARIETDLDIRAPKAIAFQIENRRGRVEAFDISAPVDITTAHDDIEVGNLTGGLRAKTRHGEIRASGLSGDVALSNRDGAIVVENLEGDLRAETSHGRILAEDVSGRAVLQNRHASVQASRIGGGVSVTAEHSEVSVETVGADVTIKTTHGPVFTRDVSGSLSIGGRNSAIQAREIGKDVTVEDQDEAVTIVNVGGSVEVRAPNSRVTVEEVAGSVAIESSHDDVQVNGFGSSLTIRSRHAPLTVRALRIDGKIDIQTTYGDVELRLPPGAAVKFEGRTQDGEVRSTVPGLELRETEEGNRSLYRGATGSAGHEVSISASYGDIVIRSEEP